MRGLLIEEADDVVIVSLSPLVVQLKLLKKMPSGY